jgi:hypothetical protein
MFKCLEEENFVTWLVAVPKIRSYLIHHFQKGLLGRAPARTQLMSSVAKFRHLMEMHQASLRLD